MAFGVAGVIERAPPAWSALPPIATLRDGARPLWAIRLAAAAHQIAAESLDAEHLDAAAPPPGRAYQLWLEGPTRAQSLGLLPLSGRKVIAEMPAVIDRLAGAGELFVTLEPEHGSDTGLPSGPVLRHARFAASR